MSDRFKLELGIAVYAVLLFVFVVGVSWVSRGSRRWKR